ncbi:hypothetical protein J4E90_010924 [Alternaria incomplexa]|uniref:uncharacterized protein n=1 Tax=Alternaria incomplexa TaxID=1187928 RepID=UPI00221EFD0A|nr:uncharacterized protein J4E90_010924 [Alternaria incomplexa]KAI4906076.1 hypothetical protein J4E90_010924 [Alternaria incomplexa]
MTEIEQSSTPGIPLPPQPSAPTKSDPIDTSSQQSEHREIQAPPVDDRHDREARRESIPTPEDNNPGKDTPTLLRMAMFTAMAVWVILACYEGISHIPGAHPITAALATVLICTAITSLQPSFLRSFICIIFYALGSLATVIQTAVHEGFAHGSESHSRSSSRQRSSGSSSPKPKPAVPKKSSRISNMKI